MKINIELIAYKLWTYLLMPCWWVLILWSGVNQANPAPELVIAIVLVVANYLTYAKNRIMYWLGYVLIFFFTASIMSLPIFIATHFRSVAIQFVSYESMENFFSSAGIIFLLLYFYFWTGLGYLFESYKSFDIGFNASKIAKETTIFNFLKNPIVIAAFIIGLAFVVAVSYYRYTDPYNQCIRSFKEAYPNTRDVWIIQQCNQIINNK